MIYLITEPQGNEPDILPKINQEILYITDLERKLLTEIHPINKYWTHESLYKIMENIEEHGVCEDGADAYLGAHWIGSTEV